MTHVEMVFAADVPLEDRQRALVDIHQKNRPDQDTIAVVVTLLNDPDDSLRLMAEQVLCGWGQQAITKLLQALRSTQPTDVPYRLVLIGQLGRMGPTAARAETLLRSLMQDPDVGEGAGKALKAIRLDGDDLANRLLHWGIELALLTTVVAAPTIAIRYIAKNQPMPPVGISFGIASLVVLGLMMARIVYASDLLPGNDEHEMTRPGRWSIYLVMAIGGLMAGIALAGLSVACGGAVQQMFK